MSRQLGKITKTIVYLALGSMKIEATIGIGKYVLMVCHCYGNLYRLSIINQNCVAHNFEGIYPSLEKAIARGKSAIACLEYSQF